MRSFCCLPYEHNTKTFSKHLPSFPPGSGGDLALLTLASRLQLRPGLGPLCLPRATLAFSLGSDSIQARDKGKPLIMREDGR